MGVFKAKTILIKLNTEYQNYIAYKFHINQFYQLKINYKFHL